MAKKKKDKNLGTTKSEAPIASTSDDDWKARSDFDTLMSAKEIEQDSDRHEKAMKIGKMRFRSIKSIVDFKNEKYGPNAEAEEIDDEDDDE